MSIAENVEALAVQTSEGEYVGESLLTQLRAAVWGDTGRTVGGASAKAERILFDQTAFELIAVIASGIEELLLSATVRRRGFGHPVPDLLAWWAAFSAAAQRQETTLAQHEVADERVARWAGEIRNYFNGPRVKELTVACPRCGERYVLTGEGVTEARASALRVSYVPGAEVIASCSACVTSWVGREELIVLGRELGVELDVDGIREAMAPVVREYVEDEGRREEPYDPSNPAHRALVQTGEKR